MCSIQQKLHEAKSQKGCWGNKGLGLGYEGRYGDNAMLKVREQVSKKYWCVTELMDYVIAESEKVYPPGEVYHIFHDGLSQ